MRTVLSAVLLSFLAAPTLADLAPLQPSPFGVCALKPRYAKESRDVWTVVDELANYLDDAGVRWDRAEITWDDVQQKPGEWDWSFTDKMVAVYRKRGLSAFCLLQGKAPWMKAPPSTDEERSQFAEFVFQTVNRYKGDIRAWEIWNEPNIGTFWPQPDPASYAALLKAAYNAAKRADPACTVIMGGTSGVDIGFIEAALNAGGWDACDAVAIHPYSMAGSPTSQGLPELLRQAKEAVTRNGVRKPLWNTEVGWTTDTTPESELRQAEYLVQEYAISLAEGVEKVFWFTLGDWAERWGLIAGKRNNPDWGYTSTNRPKSAYYALKRLTAALSPAGKRPVFLGYLPGKGPAVRMAFLADGDPAKPVLVAWAPWGTTDTVVLPQTAGLLARDAHGRTVAAPKGTLKVTDAPVIVTGFKAGALKAATAGEDPFTRAGGRNLVMNPSAEGSDKGDVAFWNRGAFPDGGRNGTLDWAGDGATGGRSLALSSTKDARWHSAPVPVRPAKRYTLSARVKGAKAAGENLISIEWYTGNMWTWLSSGAIPVPDVPGTWSEVSATFTAPAGARLARISLVSRNNPGRVQWDDISLVEQP
jgi:hypothetical protein